ncbi:MAG: hypothetical protein ABJD11_12085 [Gemmatimonadota bacterium]
MNTPEPAALPVTSPAESTEAMAELVDSQVIALSVAFTGSIVARSCLVSPLADNWIDCGVTRMATTATGSLGALCWPHAPAHSAIRVTKVDKPMERIFSSRKTVDVRR